jgi:KaiC/GvpD/RAD55 family RecA-like ATPase
MARKSSSKAKKAAQPAGRAYMKTGISGFDQLFEKGIPQGSNILVSGGAGSGKTILLLQIINNAARQGKKCIYMSFEEREDRLREHMEDFGWEHSKLEKSGNLVIKRFSSFDISKSLDAIMAKERGELLIKIDPIIIPKGFKPDVIVVDSLSAISSYFIGREENYRSYIEQLFRFFEGLGATSFVITETGQSPDRFSRSGIEEFLADGVIVLYNIRRGDVRESAIEILKMRGAGHKKKVVAMQIVPKSGIEVFPDQEVFGGLESKA